MIWTSEADLAKELGLSRPQMTALRREHLIYGYWRRAKGKGKKIVISERGKEKLKAVLEAERGDVKCQSEPTSEPTSSGAVTSKPETAPSYPDKLLMTVIRIPLNPFILYATCNGTAYTVRVKSNLVFDLRDKLYAVPDQSSPPLYMQIGKPPRWRGDKHYAHYFV